MKATENSTEPHHSRSYSHHTTHRIVESFNMTFGVMLSHN